MRIKAYFETPKQKKNIEFKLRWWDHYDIYGVDIYWDNEIDHFLISGRAVCLSMAKELKNVSSSVEIEDFSVI